jgi:hypothetical protein
MACACSSEGKFFNQEVSAIALTQIIGGAISVIARLSGGLGNQLWQWAVAQSIALEFDCDLIIDDSAFKSMGQGIGNTTRRLELGEFGIHLDMLPFGGEGSYSIPTALMAMPLGPLRRYLPLINFGGRHYVGDRYAKSLMRAKCHGIHDFVLAGYFQDEELINPQFKTKILNLLERNSSRSGGQEYEFFCARPELSVAVHVRLGDYLNPAIRRYHGALSEPYFRAAVSEFERHQGSNPWKYFVFSDDVQAAKRMLIQVLPEDRFTFIPSDWSAVDSLKFMSHFQKLISSNSSFSRWAAFWNDSPNPMIVGPKPWFRNVRAESLYQKPRNWTLMDSQFN